MRPHLSLWDSVSIIIGIVVGAGIYETAPLIFATSSGPFMAMGVWALGGFLSLVGALCYAELASTYPRSGGDYVYLSLAYGPWVGFLFGWAQLAVVFTGSIGMMAYIFADYAVAMAGYAVDATFLLAVTPVLLLSAVNILGARLGKRTQNVFTTAKIVGLGMVAVAGFMAVAEESSTQVAARAGDGVPFSLDSLGLALVFVLYTYGGWNDAAFVAAELRDRRNIPLALILGTLAVAAVYLVSNFAYLAGLGFARAGESTAIAADLLARPFGQAGAGFMSILVMISALSAVNGLIFTGSRLYAEVGIDHRVFGKLSRWNRRFNAPIASLAMQALVTVALIAIVGSEGGRGLVSAGVMSLGLSAPTWEGHGGFDTLLRCTAPVFWLFFLLTGISLFVLRIRRPHEKRPFSVPFYPLTPLLFCATSAFMLYRSITYAGSLTLVGLVLLAAGFPLYLLSRRRSAGRTAILHRLTPKTVAGDEET